MKLNKIPFNKPYLTGKETHYIYDAVYSEKKISGNGKYTKLCQDFFEKEYGFRKCLLTTSCTDALEMAALLLNLDQGDEVIMPAFTFVSTANAFILRGAKIVFSESRSDHPGIDETKLEALITEKTKAIVVVHYAGVACDMGKVMDLARKYGLYVIEDAAQAIDSYCNSKPLGSFGHMAAFSFHETKNIIGGEGGMLVINDKQFEERAEIIWEKGTNRSAFFRGEVDKYNWVDLGSSFLPSEIISAFLYAQIENLRNIQDTRCQLWQRYYDALSKVDSSNIQLPFVPEYATNNAHMFYLLLETGKMRNDFIEYLKDKNIITVFHYLSLHKSPFYRAHYDGPELTNVDRYSDCLVRLPLYYELSFEQIDYIVEQITQFCNSYRN